MYPTVAAAKSRAWCESSSEPGVVRLNRFSKRPATAARTARRVPLDPPSRRSDAATKAPREVTVGGRTLQLTTRVDTVPHVPAVIGHGCGAKPASRGILSTRAGFEPGTVSCAGSRAMSSASHLTVPAAADARADRAAATFAPRVRHLSDTPELDRPLGGLDR